jgi:serine/threonine protein kinase
VTDISFGNDGEDKEELGSGAFKEVRLGFCNDQAVAVKTLNISPLPKTGNQEVDSKSTAEYHALIQDILMEVRVMSHAAISRYPNVVELVAMAFEDVVDLAERIDFFRPILLLKPSDSIYPDLRRLLEDPGVGALLIDEIINSLTCDIADGIAAIHIYGIIHADLKPENLLLYRVETNFTAKLSDFGLSGVLQSRDIGGAGDRTWLPPERLHDPSADPK